MNRRAVLLRYHEIALKGSNRGWFEERLSINARKLIDRKGIGVRITRHRGRMVIEPTESEFTDSQLISIEDALKHCFGLANFSVIRAVPTDKPALIRAAIEEVGRHIQRHGVPTSFRVLTRRSDKAFPEISTEIDKIIGGEVRVAYPELKLDLHDPAYVLGVEIRFKESFLWTEKVAGTGGLPVGTNARVMTLISGGLDSPVAAIQVLRRGAPTGFLHFYGTPFVGPEVLEKIEDLVRKVNAFQPDPQPLLVVPFGKIQEKIALKTNPKMRTILYRRMMIRIACEVARRNRSLALVTGESLGQVASQTVENLGTINEVSTLPILRPLVAYDKDEIIEYAKRWDTFDISIRPGVDCCTLFSDRHPTIRSNLAQLRAEEENFPVSELVEEALAGLEIRRIGF